MKSKRVLLLLTIFIGIFLIAEPPFAKAYPTVPYGTTFGTAGEIPLDKTPAGEYQVRFASMFPEGTSEGYYKVHITSDMVDTKLRFSNPTFAHYTGNGPNWQVMRISLYDESLTFLETKKLYRAFSYIDDPEGGIFIEIRGSEVQEGWYYIKIERTIFWGETEPATVDWQFTVLVEAGENSIPGFEWIFILIGILSVCLILFRKHSQLINGI